MTVLPDRRRVHYIIYVHFNAVFTNRKIKLIHGSCFEM